MTRRHNLHCYVALLLTLVLASCAMPARRADVPQNVPPLKTAPATPPPKTAPIAVVPPGDQGDAIRQQRRVLAAGAQGLDKDEIGYFMDVQQARLKQLGQRELAVTRQGNQIVLSMPGSVSFAVGSATLSPDAQATLALVARVLVEYRQSVVSVHGHTDDTGNPAANQRLSEQRALSVARYLMAAGVAANRLLAVGHGFARPLVANTSDEARERNRRVELKIDPLTR